MISQVFKPFLWSYDFEKLDKELNKKAIILGVLNYGTRASWKELFSLYTRDEIKEVLVSVQESEWNKKSLVFWRQVIK